ncbi:hypothetical protein GS889_14310 [Rhodococcus hoagii]|nr:hypothetical protein [Prescottella equi]
MTDTTPTRAEEVRITGDLAQVIAAHAVRAIGPEGTVMRASSRPKNRDGPRHVHRKLARRGDHDRERRDD